MWARLLLVGVMLNVIQAVPRPRFKTNAYDEKHYIWKGDLPDQVRLRPTLANGHLGTSVKGKELFANGIFNGPNVQTHRAIIPSPAAFNVSGVNTGEELIRTSTVNAREGVYTETIKGDSFVLTHKIYAHRTRTRLLVVDIKLNRNDTTGSLQFHVDNEERLDTPDVDFHVDEIQNGRRYRGGQVYVPEKPEQETTQVHLYSDVVPQYLTVAKGQSEARWVLITSLSISNEDARISYETAKIMDPDELYNEHAAGWESLWTGGTIELDGDDRLAKSLIGSLFYILSSLPMETDQLIPYVGLSPSGLPYGQNNSDYYGHIFWDQETWMFPPVLSFHSDIADILLEGRRRVLPAAFENAFIWGNSGAQYPWEGGQTGAEVCPVNENSEKELHISGDIAHAIKLYLDTTGDNSGRYDDTLKAVAEFWMSRMSFNNTLQKYTILDVIPPDEYARGVNNSAFTNALAGLSIQYAKDLLEDPIQFEDIYIPFDEEFNYHPEFDGYTTETQVKQADVILMGYPLEVPMSTQVRLNDLNFYEKMTDVYGPAMSWSMFSIGFLDTNQPERAAQNIEKNYNHIMNEFEVWNEVSSGDGAANFITGCGGFLQMIINGYGGLRVRSDRMVVNPQLPPDVTRLKLQGIDYQGSEIDLEYNGRNLLLTVSEQSLEAPPIQFVNEDEGLVIDLIPGVTFTIPPDPEGRVRGYIRRT